MNRVTHALSKAVLLAGLAGGLGVPALAVAQEEPAMQEQAMRFERVEGPDQENVPGGTIMVVAYAVIWCLLLAFVVRLGLLHRGTAQDVGRLERSLAAAIARESKAPAAVKAAAKSAPKRPEPVKKAESSSSKSESAAKRAEAESAPKKSEPDAAPKSDAAGAEDEDEPESRG